MDTQVTMATGHIENHSWNMSDEISTYFKQPIYFIKKLNL